MGYFVKIALEYLVFLTLLVYSAHKPLFTALIGEPAFLTVFNVPKNSIPSAWYKYQVTAGLVFPHRTLAAFFPISLKCFLPYFFLVVVPPFFPNSCAALFFTWILYQALFIFEIGYCPLNLRYRFSACLPYIIV